MTSLVEWVLVRHGRTRWNAEQRYLGSTDLELLPGSKAELELTAKELADEAYEAVFCSDLVRCQETLIRVRPDLISIARYDARLREMDFGLWEGKTYEQLKDLPLYRSWLDAPDRHTPPGGESWNQFYARVSSACRDIAALTEELVCAADLREAAHRADGTGPDTETKIVTDTDADTNTIAVTDTVTAAGADTDIDIGTGPGTATGPGTGNELDPDTTRGTEPGLTMANSTRRGSVQSSDTYSGNKPSQDESVPKARVLVVTHGGVIRLMRTLLMPGTGFWDGNLGTGDVVRLRTQLETYS
ncbi:histidine phosphatase family protein [Paenibacillus tuaregi]|uniref:histidine phosphatase family protein n=1 Tax=Paenibacillus tuaregi TaxID=1816681 RepID=UPI000838E3E8|nr:histidine phosphatase family protein [Paenibacillus tuaregi]